MQNYNPKGTGATDRSNSPESLPRCPWAQGKGSSQSRLRLRCYHDTEWGVPLHDEQRHFEFLLLESFQAGLSWQCVLDRREGFGLAFAAFDAVRVASFERSDIEHLLQNRSIIRNRSKIEGAVHNARCFLQVQQQWGSFDRYIWHFTDGQSRHNAWREAAQLPASSPLSETIAADLKQRGFCRLGSITVYAHLQAIGVVNDHLIGCFRYDQLQSR